MTQAARVSVTMTGRHSLEPGGVKEACESIKNALSGSPVPYEIRCLGNKFSKGGENAPEAISVSVRRMSYDVFWGAHSTFRIPDALAGALTQCLKPTSRLDVRASATVVRVTMALPTIADNSLGEKISAIMFDLPPPKTARGGMGLGEVSFDGMATSSGKDTASITFFGECESDAAGVVMATEHVLGALSYYCGECGR